MCCDGWEIYVDESCGEVAGDCPHCGGDVVVFPDGTYQATTGCNYSPCDCPFCGSQPCDQSC